MSSHLVNVQLNGNLDKGEGLTGVRELTVSNCHVFTEQLKAETGHLTNKKAGIRRNFRPQKSQPICFFKEGTLL